MALIKSLNKGMKERDSVHNITECKYFIFTDINGSKILQLDTYGSDKRKIPGKVSQSIQFSSEAIEQLKEILRNEL